MRYSMKTLDDALDFLLPEIADAKKLGSTFTRPALIRMVAEDFFADNISEYTAMEYSYAKRVAHVVCQEALKDLRSGEGCFVFGETEFSFE